MWKYKNLQAENKAKSETSKKKCDSYFIKTERESAWTKIHILSQSWLKCLTSPTLVKHCTLFSKPRDGTFKMWARGIFECAQRFLSTFVQDIKPICLSNGSTHVWKWIIQRMNETSLSWISCLELCWQYKSLSAIKRCPTVYTIKI